MARDKRTRRAEARRRYREQLRADQERAALGGDENASAATTTAVEERRSLIASIASGFSMPDVRGDLRALPAVAFRTWAFALPLAGIVLTFLVALDPDVFFRRVGPEAPLTSQAARFVYELMLIPGAGLTPVFVGGVLAPRASWLVGTLIGLAATVAFLVLLGIHGPPDYFDVALTPTIAAQTITSYLPVYLLIGAFAGWYRRWLMGMQARTRQRAEEQRRAQAREARRTRTAAARR